MFLSRSRPFVSQKHTRHYITNKFASLGHFSLHRSYLFICLREILNREILQTLNLNEREARGETKNKRMPPEAVFVPPSFLRIKTTKCLIV